MAHLPPVFADRIILRTFLGFSQPDPQAAPCREPHARGEEVFHLIAYPIGID